jgi:hypothetical protein
MIIAYPTILVTSLLAIGACTRSDSQPPPTKNVATPPPSPSVAPSTAAPTTLMGPFDTTKTDFDLTALFPKAKLTLAAGLGDAAKRGEPEADYVVVERDGRTLAIVTLREVNVRQVAYGNAKQPIESIHVNLDEPYDAFAAAHPGLMCDLEEHECTSPAYPARVFKIDVDGSKILGDTWTPRSPTYMTNPRPPWAATESDHLSDRCERLTALTTPCGFRYSAEYGFTNSYKAELSDMEITERCMRPDDGGMDFGMALLHPNALTRLEAAAKKGCAELRKELEEHEGFTSND